LAFFFLRFSLLAYNVPGHTPHTIRHRITTNSLFVPLGTSSLGTYHSCSALCWTRHVSRMPMSRAPRRLLTGWVAHPLSVGSSNTTWDHTLKKALMSAGLPLCLQIVARSYHLPRAVADHLQVETPKRSPTPVGQQSPSRMSRAHGRITVHGTRRSRSRDPGVPRGGDLQRHPHLCPPPHSSGGLTTFEILPSPKPGRGQDRSGSRENQNQGQGQFWKKPRTLSTPRMSRTAA